MKSLLLLYLLTLSSYLSCVENVIKNSCYYKTFFIATSIDYPTFAYKVAFFDKEHKKIREFNIKDLIKNKKRNLKEILDSLLDRKNTIINYRARL